MTYRTLVGGELGPVRMEYEARGIPFHPEIGQFMGAMEGSKLQGFVAIQHQIHLEPMVIYDPHCMTRLFREAEKEVVRKLGPIPVWCLAEGRVADIAKYLGFSPRSETLFHKTLPHSHVG